MQKPWSVGIVWYASLAWLHRLCFVPVGEKETSYKYIPRERDGMDGYKLSLGAVIGVLDFKKCGCDVARTSSEDDASPQ